VCWRSKFESSSKCIETDGSVDADVIAEKFVKHFSNCFSCNDENRRDILKDEYIRLRENYLGLLSSDHISFDTELVSKVVLNLHRGKAIDIDGLTCEHLPFSHPLLPLILSHFFQLNITQPTCVPVSFKRSYIVPIPKPKDTRTKAMSCNDFRAITISHVLSKVFEYCILEKFQSLFATEDNQIGFKKKPSCNHTIYTVRDVVDRYVNGGNTVNLCAIDLGLMNAFDKVNHHAL